jgi:hypothetical protein
VSDPLGGLLSAALQAWVLRVADDVNDGHRFALAEAAGLPAQGSQALRWLSDYENHDDP